jgi:hypothetical protein
LSGLEFSALAQPAGRHSASKEKAALARGSFNQAGQNVSSGFFLPVG